MTDVQPERRDVSDELVMRVKLGPTTAARELVALRADADIMRDHLTDARAKCERLAAERAEAESGVVQLTKLVAELTDNLDAHRAENERLAERQTETFDALTETIGKLAERVTEINTLKAQLDKAVTEMERVKRVALEFASREEFEQRLAEITEPGKAWSCLGCHVVVASEVEKETHLCMADKDTPYPWEVITVREAEPEIADAIVILKGIKATPEIAGLQAKLDGAITALEEIRDRDFGDAVYLAGLARETADRAMAEIREEGQDDDESA